jgi:hypothetical protein
MPSVRLVERGRADVWLAPATDPIPDGRPLVVQLHEVGWQNAALREFLTPTFAAHLGGFGETIGETRRAHSPRRLPWSLPDPTARITQSGRRAGRVIGRENLAAYRA